MDENEYMEQEQESEDYQEEQAQERDLDNMAEYYYG